MCYFFTYLLFETITHVLGKVDTKTKSKFARGAARRLEKKLLIILFGTFFLLFRNRKRTLSLLAKDHRLNGRTGGTAPLV